MSTNVVSGGPMVAEKIELARYTLNGTERILYGKVIDGLVRVTDHPEDGNGRSYLVEPGLKCDGHLALKALLADYTRTAQRANEIPMRAALSVRIEQIELARYRLTHGERVLYGERVDGVVRVTDRPARGPGRSYLVDCGLERDGYAALKALIDDYKRQAVKHDEIPMVVQLRDLPRVRARASGHGRRKIAAPNGLAPAPSGLASGAGRAQVSGAERAQVSCAQRARASGAERAHARRTPPAAVSVQ